MIIKTKTKNLYGSKFWIWPVLHLWKVSTCCIHFYWRNEQISDFTAYYEPWNCWFVIITMQVLLCASAQSCFYDYSVFEKTLKVAIGASFSKWIYGREYYVSDLRINILLFLEIFAQCTLNSSCPRALNIKLVCYSQSKNRLHRNPLYFVTSIVGAGNKEGKSEWRLQLALGCDELNSPLWFLNKC